PPLRQRWVRLVERLQQHRGSVRRPPCARGPPHPGGDAPTAPERAMKLRTSTLVRAEATRTRIRPMRALVVTMLLATAIPALASTAIQMDVPALTAHATEVVHGRIVSSVPGWTGDHRRIVTRVEVEVLETWKGTVAGKLTVVQPGGEVDGIGQRVSGVAELGPGEEVVLFLERTGPNHRVVGL